MVEVEKEKTRKVYLFKVNGLIKSECLKSMYDRLLEQYNKGVILLDDSIELVEVFEEQINGEISMKYILDSLK